MPHSRAGRRGQREARAKRRVRAQPLAGVLTTRSSTSWARAQKSTTATPVDTMAHGEFRRSRPPLTSHRVSPSLDAWIEGVSRHSLRSSRSSRWRPRCCSHAVPVSRAQQRATRCGRPARRRGLPHPRLNHRRRTHRSMTRPSSRAPPRESAPTTGSRRARYASRSRMRSAEESLTHIWPIVASMPRTAARTAQRHPRTRKARAASSTCVR